MADISGFFSRATSVLRKCLALLEPGTRRKWLGLVVLALVVSVLEAIAAVFVLVLLSLVTAPHAPLPLPLIGDLREAIPDLDQPRVLAVAASVVAVFFAIRAGIYLAQSYLQNRLAYQAGALLARRLLRGYLATPYVAFLSRNSAEMIRNAHESTVAFASWVLFPGIVLAAEAFVTAVLCVVLFLSTPFVAFVAFSTLGILVAVILRVVQPRLLNSGRQVQDHTTESLKSLQQSLHGLRDIRVLGREKFFEETFYDTRVRLADAYAKRGVLIDAPRVALETSVLLIMTAFLVMQVSRDQEAGASITVLGLFGYASFRILPSVNRIVNNLQSVRFATPLIDSLYADAVAADVIAVPGDTPPSTDLPFTHSIELRGVSFRYPDSTIDAVTDVTLSIAPGESLGVVGRSGSGKSTLLDLILGLLEPTRGEIVIDGRPLTGRVRAWYQRVGVVPQTILLLDDTIRNNIALGRTRSDVDEERVWEAVRIAQLADFITGLPNGLDTMVGERGVKLSGGQRQRLAIARAMYQRPQVLLFDEGTSALDSKTEAEFINALPRVGGALTVISVAHRLTTIRNCHRVLVLRDGRAVGFGTFDELAGSNDEFRALARTETSDPGPKSGG